MINRIFNEDCFETMKKMGDNVCDIILTSPFYNTNEKAGQKRTLQNTSVKERQYNYVRYDTFVDSMSNDDYINFSVNLFKSFDKVLKPNGVILYNISYGSKGCNNIIDLMYHINHKTDFMIADTIIWKKSNAFPNSCSPNKLTRIWEFIFVICRKSEFKTFYTNKKVTSKRTTGQNAYENIFNFIEAKNNDGSCPYNKATYSSDLCLKLLNIYAPENAVVYDPFMGTGTTAVACKKMGLNYIGSEISENQCKWANERINKIL